MYEIAKASKLQQDDSNPGYLDWESDFLTATLPPHSPLAGFAGSIIKAKVILVIVVKSLLLVTIPNACQWKEVAEMCRIALSAS